jgi:hypothetical protein
MSRDEWGPEREALLDMVDARATPLALKDARLSALMVVTVTREFLKHGDPDGTHIQVAAGTVGAACHVGRSSVCRVRGWLFEQGIGHWESGAVEGVKAVWWHLSAVSSEECMWCSSKSEGREGTPAHHSRPPLPPMTPAHEVGATNRPTRPTDPFQSPSKDVVQEVGPPNDNGFLNMDEPEREDGKDETKVGKVGWFKSLGRHRGGRVSSVPEVTGPHPPDRERPASWGDIEAEMGESHRAWLAARSREDGRGK